MNTDEHRLNLDKVFESSCGCAQAAMIAILTPAGRDRRHEDKAKFYRESDVRAMKESEQFRRGIAHFNARRFFEAHEVWEELWLVEPEPEKTFLQGMIQLAAAYHHHCRGNRRGTESLLAAGLAKLGRFPDDHRGVSLVELRAEAEQWAKALSGGKDPGARKPPRIRLAARAGRKRKRGG